MQTQTITFDRFFSVVRHHANWGKWTCFGFEAAGTKVYHAEVYGHPPLVAGMPLRLAVLKEGDWKNICGWKDLTTGQVVVENGRSEVVFLLVLWTAFICMMISICFLRPQESSLGQQSFVGILIAAYTLIFIRRIQHGLRKMAARRVLASADSHSPRLPSP
jgi:hypothetical protein